MVTITTRKQAIPSPQLTKDAVARATLVALTNHVQQIDAELQQIVAALAALPTSSTAVAGVSEIIAGVGIDVTPPSGIGNVVVSAVPFNGVQQLLAGVGITLSPPTGVGVVEITSSASGSGFTASPTAPSSPNVCDRWVQTTTGIEFTWFNDGAGDQWVEFN